MENMVKPEINSPAGDYLRMEIAFHYGADAVYLGGKLFNLRAGAKNFEIVEIKKAIEFAHSINKKVYVLANIFARDDDFEQIESFISHVAEYNPDAFIVSDLGVLSLIKRICKVPVFISTQANTTNSETAKFYKDIGVKRIILARELSFKQIEKIKKSCDIEVEVFVHGAICLSYSGRCYLSDYIDNRSANRGECSHVCRRKVFFNLDDPSKGQFEIESDARNTYVLNSADIKLIEEIPMLMDIGVDSFKIEGRIKSESYVAVTAAAYRNAIEAHNKKEQFNANFWNEELKRVNIKGYNKGFFYGEPDSGGISDLIPPKDTKTDYLALVKDIKDDYAHILSKNQFKCNEEIFCFNGNEEYKKTKVLEIKSLKNVEMDVANPGLELLIKTDKPVKKFNILRSRGGLDKKT
ncbi:MAG: U32 family peptidase [Pseudomonadota bacterium]